MIDLHGPAADVSGTWRDAGTSPTARSAGVAYIRVSTARWAIWAVHAPAWGRLVMQACCTAGSVRGLLVNHAAMRATAPVVTR